jgi:hypothetical protein
VITCLEFERGYYSLARDWLAVRLELQRICGSEGVSAQIGEIDLIVEMHLLLAEASNGSSKTVL